MPLDVAASMPAAGLYGEAAPEARLVALGERIARELYPVFDYVALVLKSQLPTDTSAFLACLGALRRHRERSPQVHPAG